MEPHDKEINQQVVDEIVNEPNSINKNTAAENEAAVFSTCENNEEALLKSENQEGACNAEDAEDTESIEAVEDAYEEDEEDEEEDTRPFLQRVRECELFTKPFVAFLWVFAFCLVIYIGSRFVPAFAEFWTRYPAQFVRLLLAKITNVLPFSFAECAIISLPVITIGYIIASNVSTRRDTSNRNFYRWIRPLICLMLTIFTLFLGAFGPAYSRYKLSDNLGIEQNSVTAQELYNTAVIVSLYTSYELSEIKFDASGASVMEYDFYELADKINASFDKFAEDKDFISHFSSKPKPLAVSSVMTYTHISGVYTFMSGEANINTNYPDFIRPFTIAHEMAHQRGIAREDEANFVAFLVCTESDDPFVRYSGYSNMLKYLMNALASSDMALYKQFISLYLPKEVSREYYSYSLFFDKYRENVASDLSGTVNNTFLQSQGQAAGSKSYGLVVDLAVAYYKEN